MSEFIVYPAIDLRDGKVVRLRQGMGDQQTIYGETPDLIATDWIEQGANWLHVVDLNGAFGEDADLNEIAIRNIAAVGNMRVKIQLGGGLRTIEQISAAFGLGVSRIVLGTAVIENPAFGEKVLKIFGGEKIAIGFDALDQVLMIRGWQNQSRLSMNELAERLVKAGAKTLIYTNIKKDGMQTGVDWENTKQLAEETGLSVIASGGTSTLKDIASVRKAGLAGVIVGRALYEGNFTLKEALNVC
ncbi:1-(5-phosphoribosyl)-5-[(5-phosphoribosylamino)methylideneamino]imidazole-4-carboxamide isomerase [Chloroflexota bacterium]